MRRFARFWPNMKGFRYALGGLYRRSDNSLVAGWGQLDSMNTREIRELAQANK